MMTSRILNLKIKVLWPLDWSSEQSITCWQWCCNEPLGTALTHSFCVSLVTPLIPQDNSPDCFMDQAAQCYSQNHRNTSVTIISPDLSLRIYFKLTASWIDTIQTRGYHSIQTNEGLGKNLIVFFILILLITDV